MVRTIPEVPAGLNKEQARAHMALDCAAAKHALATLPESSDLLDKVRAIETAVARRRSVLATLLVVLSVACGGAVDSEPVPAEPEPASWCGFSFDQAVEVYAPERVCQTTVYDKVTGYCTFYEPCSSIER